MLQTAYKHSKYHATLGFILGRHLYDPQTYPWWNQIDQNLYLGALPLKSLNHLQKLQDLGITYVLSVLEDFEISIPQKEWEQAGIVNHVFTATDNDRIPIPTLTQIITDLHQALSSGQVVYIHCKAGVGRSAISVMTYLLVHGLQDATQFQSAQDAFNYVLTKRPLVNLNQIQTQCLQQFALDCGKNLIAQIDPK